MSFNQLNVYPLSQARAQLGKLVEKVERSKTIYLTKEGKIKAALVDVNYLNKIQQNLRLLYRKTFIDKNLLPLTRAFSDQEINQWLEEDEL